MSHTLKVPAVIGLAITMSGFVTAQGLVTERNLSLAMAKTIAEATIAECKAKGFNTAAAVVTGAAAGPAPVDDLIATASP